MRPRYVAMMLYSYLFAMLIELFCFLIWSTKDMGDMDANEGDKVNGTKRT